MNHSITPTKVYVSLDRLTHSKTGREEAYWFGISVRRGMAIGAHILTASGANIRHVPLSWLAAGLDIPMPDHPTQLWECFSNQGEVTQFAFLDNYACTAYPAKDHPGLPGRLLFTVDFLPDGNPDVTLCRDPEQGKLCHIIQTDAGHFIAMPTNRVVFNDGFFIGREPKAREMGYKTMTDNEVVEQGASTPQEPKPTTPGFGNTHGKWYHRPEWDTTPILCSHKPTHYYPDFPPFIPSFDIPEPAPEPKPKTSKTMRESLLSMFDGDFHYGR